MLLIVAQEALSQADDLFQKIGIPVGFLGFVYWMVRLAVGSSEKSGDRCQTNLDKCISGLENANKTNESLTEEVRKNNETGRRYLDEQFTSVHRAMSEILVYVREP